MTKEQLNTFHASLTRCVADEGFLERFYFLFMASSPAVADKFKKTNWIRQRRMLVASFYLMMAAEEGGDTAHIDHLATAHGTGQLNIPASMYDAWLEALVQAAGEYDPAFDADTEAAWREMMRRGIARMKAKAGPGATGRTTPRVPPVS